LTAADTSPATTVAARRTLLADISGGLVIGFIEVIICLSLASMIFAGPLSVDLPRGIGLMLVTGCIHLVVTGLLSPNKGIIGSVQDNPAALLAAATSALVAGQAVGPSLSASVFALLFLSTLFTGGFLLLLGQYRLGGLVRYIPYPVIGGFLAATGWLLAQGAIGSMAGYSLTPQNFPALLRGDQIALWLPGLLFSLALFFGLRRVRHTLALPGILLAGLAVFYIALLLTGTSIQTAIDRHLLLGDAGGSSAWQPLPIADLLHADWGALLGQAGSVGAVMALVSISVLLNVSGIEIALRQDIVLNDQLRVIGGTNLFTALAGGMIGYPALSLTTLNQRMGARGRLSAVTAAAVCLLMLLVGTSLLRFTPIPILGGLLLFLGLDFLDEWVIQSRKRLSPADYGVVLLILGIVAVSGFMVGIATGLVLMVVSFVYNYSRINIFHSKLSGEEVASHVQRSAHYQRSLARLSQHIYVLELQGFIFFGTANVVLEQIRQRLADAGAKPLHYLVLDFRRVTGLDSSAAYGLVKVRYLADMQGFTLVFSNFSEQAQRELARSGLQAGERLRFFPDLDYAMEWCEDQLLETSQVTREHLNVLLHQQLAERGFSRQNTERLKTYLERQNYAPGEYLMRQGDASDSLFFIEIGQVSVYLDMPDGKSMRLQTLNMGTIVGELAFFLKSPRSASVIAVLDTHAYRLTRDSMTKMTVDEPQLAAAFNQLMVQVLSERLVSADRSLVALNR
jgi:SulP family sulfate permease